MLLSFYQEKESNQRKIKASDNFGAPVSRLAHAIQLAPPRASVSLKQYCLLKATAASLKTVAIPQNYLRPFEIQLSVALCVSSVDLCVTNQLQDFKTPGFILSFLPSPH
jgi:hypothetical protein